MPNPSPPLTSPAEHELRASIDAMDLRLQLLQRRLQQRRLAPHHLRDDLARLRSQLVTLSRQVDQERPR